MTTAHDFSFTAIDGKALPLSQFKGRPVLVVNVASKCGLTPQYEGLVSLYHDLKDKGLVVLGVPSNQFMGQEPGTNEEIATFCSTTFGVDFPLTEKVDVKGDTAHPFYKWMKQELGEPADPMWNFHKLLFGKDGQPISAFGPRTEPTAPEIRQAVEAALSTTAFDFEFTGINGAPLPLKQFEGQALLVVNVASRCGFTPQYSGLQALYQDMQPRGLTVVGVPCNQFLWQEPQKETEIAAFCEVTYHITFPMTEKTHVKGGKAHPFYKWMRERLGKAAHPAWNFHKLLTDKSGRVAAFKSNVTPESAELRAAIARAL